MKGLMDRLKPVSWRGWDVKAVEDKHKLYGPLPTASDDFAYVVDNPESNNDYGRFLRLGALINQRMTEFASVVADSLDAMAQASNAHIEETARQVQDIQRRLDSATQSYEQLRTIEHKFRLIDSLDARVGAIEKQVKEKCGSDGVGSGLSDSERDLLNQVQNALDHFQQELRRLTTRVATLESQPPEQPRNERRAEQPVTYPQPAAPATPHWLSWLLVGLGVLLAIDVVSRFVK